MMDEDPYQTIANVGAPDLNVTRQSEVRLRLNSRESQDSIRSLPPL